MAYHSTGLLCTLVAKQFTEMGMEKVGALLHAFLQLYMVSQEPGFLLPLMLPFNTWPPRPVQEGKSREDHRGDHFCVPGQAWCVLLLHMSRWPELSHVPTSLQLVKNCGLAVYPEGS